MFKTIFQNPLNLRRQMFFLSLPTDFNITPPLMLSVKYFSDLKKKKKWGVNIFRVREKN